MRTLLALLISSIVAVALLAIVYVATNGHVIFFPFIFLLGVPFLFRSGDRR